MTDAELAILSIIAEGPIYGYTIQTVIAERGLRAWTNIGTSSIYYVLEKLERQGLVESEGVSEDEGEARRQYRITSAGFGVLQTAVADLISTPREYASSFELGLANLHVLRSEQIRTAFIAYRQVLISRLTQTREQWLSLKENNPPFNVDALFGHHIALLEAELEWIKHFIDEWEAQAPPEPPPAPPPEPVEIPRIKQVVLPHDPDSFHRAPTRPLNHLHQHPIPDTSEPPSPPAKTTTLSTKTPVDLPRLPDQDPAHEPDIAPGNQANAGEHGAEIAPDDQDD